MNATNKLDIELLVGIQRTTYSMIDRLMNPDQDVPEVTPEILIICEDDSTRSGIAELISSSSRMMGGDHVSFKLLSKSQCRIYDTRDDDSDRHVRVNLYTVNEMVSSHLNSQVRLVGDENYAIIVAADKSITDTIARITAIKELLDVQNND